MGTVRWLVGVLPVGGLLSAFWVLPFVWQSDFVNDMGWEMLPHLSEANDFGALRETLFTFDWGEHTFWHNLVPRSPDSAVDLRWVIALALVGLVLSLFFRIRADRKSTRLNSSH